MKQILFVEDDPILGPVYEKQLANAGFDVTLATDGEAGRKAIQQTKPDLVILDLDLPIVSGVELLKIIRSSEELKDVPVFVFTSAFEQGILDEIKQLDPQGVLPKSKNVPREVVQKVQALFRTRSLTNQNNENNETSITESEADEKKQIRRQLKELLEACRAMVLEANKQTASDARVSKLQSLSRFLNNLAGGATAAGLKGQSYFCEALRALVDDIARNSSKINESNMRTITQAVDFLFEEFDFEKSMEVPEDLGFKMLVVDDDAISRRAICVALNRINQKAVDPKTVKEALEHTQEQAFDLIFLDVDMPEMSGFDLCAEIRKSGLNKETPVIFVTGLTDLHSRAKSMLSGGNDFIAKPFQFMELAVKSLIHLLRRKLH